LLNIWYTIRLGGVPNFTKITQTVAVISRFTIFKMAAFTIVNLLRYSNSSFFSDGGCLPFWICGANFSKREFNGLYHYAKFGWNNISRVNNTPI